MVIEYLVFEGGGIKALGFGGCYKYLEEMDLLKNIKGAAGSSAGSIFAAAVCVGIKSDKIIEIFKDTDFSKFKDGGHFGYLSNIYNLIRHYSLYKGDKLYKWISNMVNLTTGNSKITFKELYDKYNKHLVITGCCISKGHTVYFHHEDPKYRDMPIALAIRISMSVPFYWKPITYKGDLFIDGGVLDKYPIWVFDGDNIGYSNLTDDEIEKSKTLGFKLKGNNERDDITLYNIDNKVNNILDYYKVFINTIFVELERKHVRSKYWDITINVDTGDIMTTDFDLNMDKKIKLVNEGYKSTKIYFSQ